MKATELRIGNYIMFHNDEILTTWEDIRFMITSRHQNKYHKPIPLTEQWLLKFGFEKDFANDGFKFNNLILDSEERLHIIDRSRYGIIISRCVKHVHQLQNLYFALTGKELEIKN